MKRKCCVPLCNSAAKCTTCQVSLSYFKAPKESTLARKWELALGLKEESLIPRDRVCSSHFRKADILTKRFVSLKRPSTNSKMILEISKLERQAVPTTFHHEARPCGHGVKPANKQVSSSSSVMKSSRSEGSSSAPASSQSDDDESDESSGDEERTEKRKSRPTRRDYRLLARNVEHRSLRRQIRAYANLEKKWLDKSKALGKQIRMLANRIRELEMEELESYKSQ